MRYLDAEKRISELRKIANVFKEKGFVKTENRLFVLSLLMKDDVNHDFMAQEHINLMNIFGNEFAEASGYGYEYRWNCIKEIGDLIHDLIEVIGVDKYRKTLSETISIITNLSQGKKTIDEINKILSNKSIDPSIHLHLTCYRYLVIIEGVFDELARIIFLFATLRDGKIMTVQEVQRLEVKDIYNQMTPKPAILKNWEEKKHIRNAIGHATAYFNQESNSIRFIDRLAKPVTFDKTYRWEEFIEILSELDSSISAFILFILLLIVRDLILVTEDV